MSYLKCYLLAHLQLVLHRAEGRLAPVDGEGVSAVGDVDGILHHLLELVVDGLGEGWG